MLHSDQQSYGPFNTSVVFTSADSCTSLTQELHLDQQSSNIPPQMLHSVQQSFGRVSHKCCIQISRVLDESHTSVALSAAQI